MNNRTLAPSSCASLGNRKTTATDWFCELAPHIQHELQRSMRVKIVDAGQFIYREGDGAKAMYRIASGRVRIRCISPSGKEVLMVIYGAGNFIGSLAVLDGRPRHNDAVAERKTTLGILTLNQFHCIAQIYPEIYRSLALNYAMWIRDHQAMMIHSGSLEERLARRLDFLLDYGAEEESESGFLRIGITQETLAASVGVSRQTINKILKNWQDDELIRYKYRSVLIVDRSSLRRIAYNCPIA